VLPPSRATVVFSVMSARVEAQVAEVAAELAAASQRVAGRAFPASEQWRAMIMPALAGIPDVKAGDSAWWHTDMIHAVAPVVDQKGWGNVMYIPAAPWCERNERYSALVRSALLSGESPDDFPEEHYEATWPDRFPAASLNETGRRGMGLAAD
jgi:Protein of unknown function (DUF1479)